GTRVQTTPDAFATSTAATLCRICSCSSSSISCGSRITRTISSRHAGAEGLPGGLGRKADNLTGVLEATVRDPSGQGPAARLIGGRPPPRGTRESGEDAPIFTPPGPPPP